MDQQFSEQIANVPLFEDADHAALVKFLEGAAIKEYGAGDYICREGEYDENCSIILSGSAYVVLPQKGAQRIKKIPLPEGEVFGEIAALSGNPRTADIVSARPCSIMNISRNKLFKMLDKFPTIKTRLDKLYRERALKSHLLTIPIFAGIPDDLLEELANNVTLHSYNTGDPVFKQDDDADAFYLVRYGFVKIVQTTSEGKQRILAYLKDGHYFGEMGLLKKGEKRMATVAAINRAELIRISTGDFQKLMETHPSIKRNLEKVIERREKRNIQISKDQLLEKTLSAAVESGVIQSKAVLIMDQTKCVQCDNCVKACAALHENQSRLVRKGVKFNNFLLIPTSCRHCEDPSCMSRCPTGAITRGHDGEIYHQDHCVGCGSCAKRCPFGNISIVNITEKNERFSISGFVSRLFSRKGNGDSGGTDSKTGKKDRFVFPGDRDMVQRPSSELLPGDRDMVGSPAASDGKSKKKKKVRRKAVKCDMCRDYDFMGCVYNCPRGAARRVDPTEFFSDIAAVG